MGSDTIIVTGHKMHVQRTGDPSLPAIVFLHGFTGSSETWREVISHLGDGFQTAVIDLWGHGRSDSPENSTDYEMRKQIEDLEQVFSQLNLQKFILVGYSMGGRVALGYAAAHPERIQALVLESASPGLKTESERSERMQRDAKLAGRLLTKPIEDFVDFWENLALFNSQKALPAVKQEAIRAERLSQNPRGLANSLLGIGTGSQPSYWGVLSSLTFPLTLVTGSCDAKFETIAGEMKNSLKNVRHVSVKNAGHAIHVEKPVEFATIINEVAKQN
ncbi:2-succinyl-6-hydroxy-2,4-cyclohexadiene-1-carboxylate synthase [Sporosarcina aquimarina]|uniref:Putative 2-succinyl-6-hydroxy-2,4-cyclohexadiene-1-carboxylate synthase n=1 Tax=Sporosarcina aquimarina TaxID=114975 RepID=A0ABU4FZN9_9BACL|nr:2-succinyl-6-hydroxy-2,4-cyclohexadiene-1-carboxylate synthase [Sporosarcina aquimarina]MDW0110179.1 2-succinyl-6-hydroxy-2,4-cyclohexadiene-1-carboxylate synthase [Sporosarcina aquimarina]